MDVTCDNCKAEYDFDDTLLGDKGTTVKCSKCGHVFRVMPPHREPTRSALKVRFRDGRVESVASLRELQQRIQAGQVGFDDELGRDGFNFRRLGDVPELKNFFARNAPASAPVPAAQAGTLPYRGEPIVAKAAPKRTILGIGGGDVPSAPRAPNFGPAAAAQALAPTQPGATTPKSTLQGRAPISNAPTSPGTPTPARDLPRQRTPISSAPTPTNRAPSASDSAPTRPAIQGSGGALGPASATAPTQLAPATNTGSSLPPRPAAPALRLSDSALEGPLREAPHAARAPALDSIAPGALKAASLPKSGAPRPGADRGVRLSLDDDEPERERGGGGARWLLYAASAALLGAGAWLAVRQLADAPKQPAPLTSVAPQERPTPSPGTSSVPPAAPEATAAAPDAGASAPAPTEAPAEPTPTAEKAAPPAAASEKLAAKAAPSKTRAASEGVPKAAASESGSSTREPKDYAGWVGRGDQLLGRGDLAGAQQAFESAVALRASGSEANSGLGAALVGQGQTREAIPFLTRAANNGFAEASIGLGDAYRKLGDKEAAIEAYETYLARLPKGARANYVRLQLEGLGRDPDAAKPSAPHASPPEGQPAPSTEYRPAGELEAPPSAPPTPESPQ